jgi:hypothetical protein
MDSRIGDKPSTQLHLQSTTSKMQLFSIYLVHKTLYMFQAVPPPIIRSIKLYIQRQVFVRPMLLPAAIVEEMELHGVPSFPR